MDWAGKGEIGVTRVPGDIGGDDGAGCEFSMSFEGLNDGASSSLPYCWRGRKSFGEVCEAACRMRLVCVIHLWNRYSHESEIHGKVIQSPRIASREY